MDDEVVGFLDWKGKEALVLIINLVSYLRADCSRGT